MKLIEIVDMGNELFDENILACVIDEYGSEVFSSYNDLMHQLMVNIVDHLVEELDQESEIEDFHRSILENKWAYPFVNYLDSHFQIDCLDEWNSGDDRDQLLIDLSREILKMRDE